MRLYSSSLGFCNNLIKKYQLHTFQKDKYATFMNAPNADTTECSRRQGKIVISESRPPYSCVSSWLILFRPPNVSHAMLGASAPQARKSVKAFNQSLNNRAKLILHKTSHDLKIMSESPPRSHTCTAPS